MQNRVVIVHGWEGRPDEPLYASLKQSFEKHGFVVSVPAMPDTETPRIGPWVARLSEVVGGCDANTFFVGHSVGCQGVLRYLQTLSEGTKIGGCVFIAPWMELDEVTIEEEGEEVVEVARPWMETPIDFEKIRKMTDNFVCLLSDNDYYVPVESNKKLFSDSLGASIIIEHGKGHFVPDDGVVDCPTAVSEVLRISGS